MMNLRSVIIENIKGGFIAFGYPDSEDYNTKPMPVFAKKFYTRFDDVMRDCEKWLTGLDVE